MKERRAQRLCFAITLRVGRQQRFNIARAVEKVSVNVQEPRVNDIAIVSATRDETERVAIELAHHARDWFAFWSRRNGVVHFFNMSV